MVDEPSQPEPSSRSSRPWLAALLSFVFPGLGQAYRDRRTAALVFAIPMLVLVFAVIGILMRVIEPPRNVLLSTGFLIGVLVLNGVIFAWRSASIAQPSGASTSESRAVSTAIHPPAAIHPLSFTARTAPVPEPLA